MEQSIVNTKAIFMFAALLCCAFSALAAPQNHDLPETVTVLGQPLHLKEYQRSDHGELLAEYIPQDQNWENWRLMFAIRIEKGKGLDPLTTARGTAKNIEARKAFDIMANHATYQYKDGSVLVDFLISDQPEKNRGDVLELNTSFYEHNLWRYFKVRDGLASYQIARRIYLKDVQKGEDKRFIKSIATMRQRLFDEIANPNLPLPDHAQ